MNTYLWYDLETFGLVPNYDRIAQFAAIRTDMDFNQIAEPIMLYCKLTPDYLPDPRSVLVTGITPETVNTKGLCEEEFIARIRKEMMEEDTITVGFNSVKFDDEFIRNALYRNLYDPYEREYATKTNNRSRWDIINLVRATHDLRPNGINFTKKNEETGAPSYKLTDLTEENNIDQRGAHDALVDVRATIAIAKLIRSKAPKLYDYALNLRKKSRVNAELKMWDPQRLPVLYTSPVFQNEKGCTRPVLPLFYCEENPNDAVCVDLTKDIDKINKDVYRWSEDSPFVIIRINKCPMVSPISTLTEECEKRLGLNKKEALDKARTILEDERFKRKNLDLTTESFDSKSDDPEFTLYTGNFMTKEDKTRTEKIRSLSPDERLKSGEHYFHDPKYHTLLWRQVARNYPKVLSDEDLKKWKNFCAGRLLQSPIEGGRTLSVYLRDIENGLSGTEYNGAEKKLLISLQKWGKALESKVLN